MPTKQNPGLFDCYKAALPDEPIFVILGRDPAGPATLDFWASQRIKLGKTVGDDDKNRIKAAIDEAKEMQDWRTRMLDASVEGIPPWRLPVHFIGEAEIEHPDMPSREQYVPVEDAAYDAAARDERTIRLLATMRAALDEVDKAHKGLRDPWIALGEVERVLQSALDKISPVAEDPPVGDRTVADCADKFDNFQPRRVGKVPELGMGYTKSPSRDVTEIDTPDMPPHRFAMFDKGAGWAYGRGLEINPAHIPAMLDRMEQDGYTLVAALGAQADKVGMIFRREPEPVMIRSPEGQRVVIEYAERLPNGDCQITRVPFGDLPEWTHPCYGRGRGLEP